ncbi:peptide methionine sulfoxide reductase MsrA [Polaribacter pacificus]|uniref:Peptide methionine sulfoxide reductase MsrA n=1 Tax=Polaribacter pacificus TaxID=1775173 RepID=A0A917MBQ4_9FLAO|nr:peptide-methionine (S)-S-oxide reductase MsrA [Polaribacter pacificus]GGG90062.1 peptide methionine sulfoxide reductase MsrA [Polaribacter pacificus]
MNKTQTATFGGGCFWCTEAVFQEVKGVLNVVSGYSGGTVPGRPTYREICSGLTGHAEVVQITFDSTVVSFETLVLIFMTTHNPTTLNQQGADRGTQYRSVIFYEDEQQAEIAKNMLLQVAPYYSDAIVTEVSPLKEFFEAEQEHQDFYIENQEAQYCTYVINPKLAKLRQLHADKLKK